jgi:hypothetical protein
MYTKVIQAGDQIEVYQYQKKLNVSRQKRNYRKNKRRSKKENDSRNFTQYRTNRSIQRARQSFFRLVAANLHKDKKLAFVTLTTFEQKLDLKYGYQALRFFWKNVRRLRPELKYILVPEWQKRGALHYHCLVWGLTDSDVYGEKRTRNFQRCWARGFVDVRFAKNSNLAIAGYMAKYLVKALEDSRLSNQRAYSCSRNVERPSEAGSNQLIDLLDVVLPDNKKIVKHKIYDTLWLGECNYLKYNKKYND